MSTDTLSYVLSCLRRSARSRSSWTMTPNEAGLLVAEIERLRDQRRLDNAEAARIYDFARDKGKALERAAVVAWLRGRQEAAEWALTAAGYEHAADAIELGEHRREEE